MKLTTTTETECNSLAEYLTDRYMNGDPGDGLWTNESGESWTVYGKRVHYVSDWGHSEVLKFKDNSDAISFAAMAGGPSEDDTVIVSDTLRSTGESVYVAVANYCMKSQSVLGVASEWTDLGACINAEMDSSGYYGDVWLIDDNGYTDMLTFPDLPTDPSRLAILEEPSTI